MRSTKLLLLLLMINIIKRAENVLCWSTKIEKETCSVELKESPNAEPRVTFLETEECTFKGCRHDDRKTVCCCSSPLCNTASLAVLARTRNSSFSFGIYAIPILIVVMVVVMHLLMFLSVSGRIQDKTAATFPDRINYNNYSASKENRLNLIAMLLDALMLQHSFKLISNFPSASAVGNYIKTTVISIPNISYNNNNYHYDVFPLLIYYMFHVYLPGLFVDPIPSAVDMESLLIGLKSHERRDKDVREKDKSTVGEGESLSNVTIKAVVTYSTSDRITIRESKTRTTLDGITHESSTDEILEKVISLGPREIDFDGLVVLRILADVHDVFFSENMLLEISAPCVIYGDIHGQYSDLWRWFGSNGWPMDRKTLFLGDFVDRGRHGIEVLMLLFLLKLSQPNQLFLCRGNHEDEQVNKSYSFYSEVKHRFPVNRQYRTIFDAFQKVFSVMPLSCVVGGRIFCTHGGLSPDVNTLDDVNQIARPLYNTTKSGKHLGLLWSDPHFTAMKYKPNLERDVARGKGIGFVFGPRQISRFCKQNDLSLVVRGHQPPMSGYERMGPQLITLFSTPAYRVERATGNIGASMLVFEDGSIVIVRITAGEPLKEKRQRYKLLKGDQYKDCGKPRQHARSRDEGKYG